MLVSTALKHFIEWGKVRYAHSTVLTYSDHLRRFLAFTGIKDIEELDTDMAVHYYGHLKARNCADATKAYAMIAIRQFCKYLYYRRVIAWDYQLIAIPKYVSRHYRPVEDQEGRDMYEKIKAVNFLLLRDKTILAFLYSSGVRVAELCDLKAADIQVGKHQTVIISKKNRLERLVFWDKPTDALLRVYLKERVDHATSESLFISLGRGSYGKKLTTRSIERFVARYRVRSCISPHSFRHGLGMRASRIKMHPSYLQKILGHKNITSIQTYQNLSNPLLVKEYLRMVRLTDKAVDKLARGGA